LIQQLAVWESGIVGRLSQKDKRLFVISFFLIFSKVGMFVSAVFAFVVLFRCLTAAEKGEISSFRACFEVPHIHGLLIRNFLLFLFSAVVFVGSRYLAARIVSLKAEDKLQ